MLTEPYRIRGMVVHGAGRGAKLGFATANLDAIDTLLPGPGVYAGRGFVERCALAGGDQHRAQSDVRRARAKVEVHLIGWDGDAAVRPAAGG